MMRMHHLVTYRSFGTAWCLGVLAVLLTAAPASAQAASPTVERQMVVPFENASASARLYWLAEASAVLLTDDLTTLGTTALSRDERLLAFEQLRVPPASVLSHATVIRIGELVGVTQVVVGSYAINGETLTVRARAIRLDTGRLLPEIIEAAPLSEMFRIFDRIARRLVPSSSMSDEALEQGRPAIAAFEQYIKGLLAQSPAAKVNFFSEALRLAPAFQRVRLGLWDVYTTQGEHQRALEVVRQVPAEHRLSRRARFQASLSMLDLGQLGPAADVLADLNRQRADAALINNLGIVQFRRPPGSSLVKAASYFTEAIRLDAADADLYFNLGYAHWYDRDVPAAIEALREVVRREPADGEAHFALGVALQVSGNAVEAARERELARQLSSTYAEWAARPAGTTTVPRGLERIKTNVDLPPALRMNAVIVAAGQRDQQEQATFHLESGKRLFQAGQDAEAIAALRRAVYLAPYQSEAHLMLGRAYQRTGRLADAVTSLKISIWSADTIVARLLLAEVYLQTRNTAAARTEAQAVLRRDPANVEARRLIERMPAN